MPRMVNRVIHFEIPIDDSERAAAFYRDALGWTFSKWGSADYWTIEDDAAGSGAGADGALAPRADTPGVLVYVGVDDIDAVLAKVTDAGGEVLMPRSEIPTVGAMARFRDSEGNVIGLFQDAVPMPETGEMPEGTLG